MCIRDRRRVHGKLNKFNFLLFEMEDLKTKFQNALEEIKEPKSGKSSVSNIQKLQLYAFFKQSQEGPCQGAAPSKFNIAAKAKYDFWRKLGDMSKEEAMKGYVNLVSELYPGWEKYYNETNEPKPKL
eukprot:TRINITY_DN645_c0_g1_i1.p2 TRINITY_DN645_c0_g1~~TRINITY_DN645_c0_g1_i1.p2  ORF type:complete len:127 (+),score=31.42 TRINITY_DN645_c0_g1_i1:137-517(+)